MNKEQEIQLKKIKLLLLIFMAGLVLSGITAFPLEWEMKLAKEYCVGNLDFQHPLYQWILEVYHAIRNTNLKYPFLAYGTDWLAFSHLVIAVAFVGPYRDPVRNIWVLQFGLIACFLVIPFAFIAGTCRSIPLFWQLIDCSFGIVGAIPLWLAYRFTKNMTYLNSSKINL